MPKITITVDIPEFEDIEDEDTLIEGRRGDDPDDYRPVRKKVEGAFLAQMRREAQEQLSPLQLSFMSESRRLDNQRIKKELRARLRFPRVEDGVAAALIERKCSCS